ncbi:MAG: Ig-like domain-containing protein, partial [Gracilibacteraceae bacterium]|nr:Ig-like domain-containing protein [Gracilibacteraceae bacterium]
WAFQTEGEFSVRSTLPAANTGNVPADTDLEISFSRPVGNVAEWIDITPSLPGGWRQNGLTAVFMPGAMFAPDTLYTVTLRAGLPGRGGEALAEDYAFSFRTGAAGAPADFLETAGGFTETFLPDDPAAIRFAAPGANFAEARISASVYRVEDSVSYIALALEHRERVNPFCGRDSDALISPPAAVPEAVLEGALLETQSPGVLYFVLPENPGPGYYLLDMTVTGRETAVRRQKLICVSALSVYLQTLAGHTDVWLNDSASGQALAGAAVVVGFAAAGETAAGPPSAVTNSDGLAALDTDAAGAYAPVSVSAVDGRTWADFISLDGSGSQAETGYYSYLYFDRAAYLPSDTARFWGYLAPRRNGAALPPEVSVGFSGLPPQTVSVVNGVFTGEFTWRDIRPDRYSAEVTADGKSVLSLPLTVTDWRKPAYVVKAAAGQSIYRHGEKAEIAASLTFFDGTPAGGHRLMAENSVASESRVSAPDGSAALSLPEPEPDSWRPYLDYISIWAEENETGAARSEVRVCRFPTDYMCDIRAETVTGGFFFEVDTARIDFAKAEAALADGDAAVSAADFPAQIQGEAYEQYFDASVIRCEYLREETGEYYDFLQNQPVKQYRYTYRESIVDRLSFSTAGGHYRSETLLWPADELVSYKISLDYETPDGVWLREYVSTAGTNPTQAAPDHYYLESESTEFAPGERVAVKLRNDAFPPAGGRLFYAVFQDEALVTAVTEAAEFEVYCAEGLMPDFKVCAAYYDGRRVFALESVAFAFRAEERALRVEITPEQENYAPGDVLTAEIRVTDALGQPRRASFVFSAADEAAFTASEQEADAAAMFYRPLHAGDAAQFVSYVPHESAGASRAFEPVGDENSADESEGAVGNGDSGVRVNFRDTAAFLSGQTDGSGRAEVSFALPEGVTSWRLTAAAFTEDGYAGDGRQTVRATRPFYLDPAMSRRYTAKDDIVLVLRAGGVPPGTQVNYTVRAEDGAGYAAEQAVSAAAADYGVCNFGKLPAGSYTFRVSAVSGDAREKAAYPFLVTESLWDLPAVIQTDLSELEDVSLGFPAELVFYDRSNELYMRALGKLAGAAGARADEVIAGEFARAGLAAWDAQARAPADFVDESGGLRLLPRGGPDGLLTAKAVAAAPECLNREEARAYFYSVLCRGDVTPAEAAAAYQGLAALGAPVLTDIQTLLPNGDALFTLRDCLRLATGLALLGDRTGAAVWYEKFIAPLAAADGEAFIIDAGEGEDEAYALTAEAAPLARLIGHAQADGLLAAALERDGAGSFPLLDIMTSLRFMPEPAGSDASLRYKLDGEEISVDFATVPAHRLTLDATRLAAADFRSEGEIGVIAFSAGGTGGLELDASGKISLEKFYTQEKSLIRVTVDVSFQNNAPRTPYTLTDVLPAGLRFVSAEPDEGDSWYLSGEDGGRVDFVLNRARESYGAQVDILSDFRIIYYARVALPGEFLADSAVARHTASGLCMATRPELQAFQLAR